MKLIALATLIGLTSAHTYADELFSAKIGYIDMAPSGTVAGNVDTIGVSLDVEGDLNLDNSQDITAEVALQLGNFRLGAGYLPIDFSGTGTVTVDGSFNGQPISVDDSVTSALTADLIDLSLTYFFINMDDLPSRFQLGIEISGKFIDADSTLTNNTNPYTETNSESAVIPTIGARMRFGLGDLISFSARAGYMEIDDDSFLDIDAQIEFSPLPALGIYAGYRILELNVDQSDFFMDTEFSGAYAGVFARF